MKIRETPSVRRWLFYGLLFLIGVAAVDWYTFTQLDTAKYFNVLFWGTLIAAFVITAGQFLATVFYFVNKNRDRGFFHLFQFIVWLFVTWLTFVINISFVGMGFNSVPIRQ
jgi:hypothetical protein